MYLALSEPTITPHLAAITLHFFDGAQEFSEQPSGGAHGLLMAIGGLDENYRNQMALGFPGLVAAVRLAQNDMNGIKVLREIAKQQVLAAVR